MDIKSQVTIRTKKLGVLIRDARLAARRSAQECAEAIDIRKGLFRAYEDGLRAPSLPELEALVYYLDLPIDHFWGKSVKSENVCLTGSDFGTSVIRGAGVSTFGVCTSDL